MKNLKGIKIPPSLLQVFSIAQITFFELVREKILWSTFLFAVLSVGLAYSLSRLSFTENARIAMDFGLSAIALIGGLLSIIMGGALIAREVENRTLYLVLTKAIWRWQFVLGRILGLMAVLTVNSAMMIFVLLFIFVLSGGAPDQSLIQSFLLQITEFGILASVACVFSSFSTVSLSAMITSGVWIIGHAMVDLKLLINRVEPPEVRPIFKILTSILPDLTRFDVKMQISHDLPIAWSYTAINIVYGISYILFALILSCIIFSKRDL